jgi:hypothetical protein
MLLSKPALIVEAVEPATSLVEIVKLAPIAPGATVIVAGTRATVVLLLPRVTVTGSEGGAYRMVTVPVADAGPTTLVGFSDSAATA